MIEGAVHHTQEGVERKGLFDEIEGAELGGPHGGLDVAMS